MKDAPLYRIEEINCPKGNAYYFPLDSTNKLRIAFWNLDSNKVRLFFNQGEQNS